MTRSFLGQLVRRAGLAFVVSGALLALLASRPSQASAANLQPAGINLGGTSFYDGFGRNKGGFTYLAYFQWARVHAIHGTLTAGGDPGADLPVFNDPAIDVFVLINQVAYTVPEGLFGDAAHFGFNFLLPLIAFDASFAPPPPYPGLELTDNGIGFGDLTLGPFLQFAPILSGGRPVFSHRFEVNLVAPIGKFDPGKDLNQSSSFASLIPYWAATVMPLPHLEISARVHWLYNFKTHRPALGRLYGLETPPPVKSAQAGQATWVNFATSYELFGDFSLGANGYYFHQLNLDLWEMLDGSTNPGLMYNDTGKQKIFAIGPGAMWAPGDHEKFFANFYVQLMVETGPVANVLNLRWVHGF
jgi:hypothetical protein